MSPKIDPLAQHCLIVMRSCNEARGGPCQCSCAACTQARTNEARTVATLARRDDDPGRYPFTRFVESLAEEDTRLSMLDLFSGSGNASRAALVRGWRVVRIDNAAGAAADVRADLATWSPAADWFDLVWASPPCTLLSTANQKTRDVGEGLVLVRAALRIIEAIRPRWWVLENVHGATRAIGELIGPPVARYGSFYLWGVFPPFEAIVPREKTKLSGRRRAERRAAIPWAISNGLICACERLDRELE